MPAQLVLASQSPRRKELLEVLGVPFIIVGPQVDETPLPGEPPDVYVVRVAREKGLAVAAQCPDARVLASDTVVTIDGEILGKPRDREDAVEMLKKLSGREHEVLTAVCLIDPRHRETREGLDRTKVWFRPMSRAQILDYLERENVMDKAGAYAIQGFASVYIPKIEGSYSNVMGLPLALVWDLISK
jgi:septum formation protein